MSSVPSNTPGPTGAGVISISCNEASPLSALAEVAIELLVGGEVVAGSSRLNAGTAQKIALNTISTAVMVRLGKTYGNLMVDLRPTNAKLRDRAVRIVRAVTGVAPERAAEALAAAGWDTKLASLIAASGKQPAEVAPLLEAAGGRLRDAFETVAAALGPPTPPRTTPPARPRADRRHWRRLGVGAAFVDGELVGGDVAVADGAVVGLGLPGHGNGIAAPGPGRPAGERLRRHRRGAGVARGAGGDGPRPYARRRARLPADPHKRRTGAHPCRSRTYREARRPRHQRSAPASSGCTSRGPSSLANAPGSIRLSGCKVPRCP